MGETSSNSDNGMQTTHNEEEESPPPKKKSFGSWRSLGSQTKKGLAQFGDGFVNAASDVLPPFLLLRQAEKHAGEAEAKSQEAAQKSRDRHAAAAANPLSPASSTTLTTTTKSSASTPTTPRTSRPKLLTEDRVAAATTEGHVWESARKIVRELMDFHMFWSYLIMASFVLHPMSTAVVLIYLVATATAILSIYDLIWSFTKGYSIQKLVKRYYAFGMKKLQEFLDGGVQWEVLLVVLGIVVDAQKHRSKFTKTKLPTAR